ncbi:MAG: hypothetical protein KF873_03340 [Gemmataceae bacterium]|nr:hypothetical protein [Gemmataceae bacterium]
MNVWVVVIIIVIAVVSAIAQTIKNQQEKEQTPRRRNNNSRANASGVKTGASDMDRFLQEIEKLRKRAADGGDEPKKPTARPAKTTRGVPTVAPAKKSKRDVPTIPVSRRIEDLPPATVVPPPPPTPFPVEAPTPPPPVPALSLDRPMVSKTTRPASATPFAKNLFTMLGNKQSIPTIIVLQEIFGPPKSRRG